MTGMLKEFRPTILFLAKFIGIYFIANLAYGFWVTSYYPRPDPVTELITHQSAWALRQMGWETSVENSGSRPTTFIECDGRRIVSVFEGCNGIGVGIVFLSFLGAMGPLGRAVGWFAALGLLILYASNVSRIVFLFLVSMNFRQYFYFAHKYLFTASIYAVVLVLWVWWVKKYPRLEQSGH